MDGESDSSQRTIDDVTRILGFAKMDTNDLAPTVQCLHFSSNLDNDSLKLLEMDPNVLGHLQVGESLVIRGNKSDSAVLCTADKTFDLRTAETSNLLLVAPDLNLNVKHGGGSNEELHIVPTEVLALKQDYFELRAIKPRLKHMATLLEKNPYSGQECENDEHHQEKKYTMDDLLEEVQASEVEIKEGLRELQACFLDGYWRILDFDFESKLLSDLLALREENGWSLDAIPGKACCDTYRGIYHEKVVLHILRNVCSDENKDADSEQLNSSDKTFRLSEDKICCFFAKLLLKDVDKFDLRDFMATWQQAVPNGFNTSLDQLQGMALVERDTKPEVIRYFPVSELPEDIADRFTKLFRTKPKWTLDEMTPFLQDLCTEKLGVSGLLLKFARASTQNGIKVYSSKKPV